MPRQEGCTNYFNLVNLKEQLKFIENGSDIIHNESWEIEKGK